MDFAQFGRLSASGIDPEEVFRRDKLEGLIERHDKGAEVTRSGPSLSSPPQHLNLVALAGWPQARNGTVGAPAVERVAAAGAHDLDTAAREGVGRDAVAHLVGSDRRHRDLLCRTGLLCRSKKLFV